MPALDFPSSPTNGQVFGQYVYDSTKGAWRVSADLLASATPSPTAPVNPVSGDLWFNTNDGVMFMYLNDGNSSQWVEVKSNTASGSTVAARVDALEAKPNGLVNLIPASVSVGSGSASVDPNGLVTFTNASSVDVRNIFTTTYKRYVVITSLTAWSNNPTTTAIHGRLTKAGVNPAGYYYQSQYDNNNNANGAWTNGVNAAHFFMGDIGTGYNGPAYNSVFEVFNPQVSSVGTDGIGRSVAVSVSFYGHGIHSFHQNSSDTQDGFYVFPTAGNFTGTIQFYGYR